MSQIKEFLLNHPELFTKNQRIIALIASERDQESDFQFLKHLESKLKEVVTK